MRTWEKPPVDTDCSLPPLQKATVSPPKSGFAHADIPTVGSKAPPVSPCRARQTCSTAIMSGLQLISASSHRAAAALIRETSLSGEKRLKASWIRRASSRARSNTASSASTQMTFRVSNAKNLQHGKGRVPWKSLLCMPWSTLFFSRGLCPACSKGGYFTIWSYASWPAFLIASLVTVAPATPSTSKL